MSPLHMKSEGGKPFLEGGLISHTDATYKETLGFLGFLLIVIVFYLVFNSKSFDQKNNNNNNKNNNNNNYYY